MHRLKEKEDAPQNTANMLVDISDPKSFVPMIVSSHRSASSEWWLDSGATCHVTNDRGLLSKVRAVRDRAENCNGGEIDVTHAGTAELVLSSVLENYGVDNQQKDDVDQSFLYVKSLGRPGDILPCYSILEKDYGRGFQLFARRCCLSFPSS